MNVVATEAQAMRWLRELPSAIGLSAGARVGIAEFSIQGMMKVPSALHRVLEGVDDLECVGLLGIHTTRDSAIMLFAHASLPPLVFGQPIPSLWFVYNRSRDCVTIEMIVDENGGASPPPLKSD